MKSGRRLPNTGSEIYRIDSIAIVYQLLIVFSNRLREEFGSVALDRSLHTVQFRDQKLRRHVVGAVDPHWACRRRSVPPAALMVDLAELGIEMNSSTEATKR